MQKKLWIGIGQDTDCDGTLVFGLVMYAESIEECSAMILEECGSAMASCIVMLVESSAVSAETFPTEKIREALGQDDGPVHYVSLQEERREEESCFVEPDEDEDIWAKWNNWA